MRTSVLSEKGTYSKAAVAANAKPTPICGDSRNGAPENGDVQFGVQPDRVWRGRPRPRALVVRGRGLCRSAGAVDGGDEAVSPPGQGFDEARARCGIAQRLADLVHRGIQAVIEIDKGVGRPDLFAQLIARDHFTGILEQRREDLKRLLLKP